MSSGNSSLGIIVGIDDSPAAQVAVRWAARDAELRKIPLTLVHAVSPEVATWLEVPLPPGVLRWQQDHGRHLIDDALKVVEQASLRAGPPTVHSEIVPAAAVPTLVDMSKDAVLMVVGCLGSGRWPGRLLGSVSSGLLRHAHCPVVIIHDEDSVMPHPQQAPVLVGVLTARRPPSWRPQSHSTKRRGETWTWWRCTHGATSMCRSGPESIGRQLSRWPSRCWPSGWRVGRSGIPT